MTTMEDKLKELDQELYTLHQFCVSKGFTPQQIEKHAQPLFSMVREYKTKRFLKLAFKLAIVVGIFSALLYYDPVYKFMWALARLGSMKLLPYWDWTTLYHQQCLVDNPYYVGDIVTEQDCELCEGETIIPRVRNLTHTLVTENYLKQERPFIATDGMKEWKASTEFNVHFLNELYHTQESLSDRPPCMFNTNIRGVVESAKAVLSKAAKGDIHNYFAHWENCDKVAAKVLRQFYKRPYFVPPMVEMLETNWVFIANNYKGKKNKPIDLPMPMMWVAQIKGTMKVTLTPKEPCNETCPVLYGTLHEGDILTATSFLWMLDYIPTSTGEMIALGGGGVFD